MILNRMSFIFRGLILILLSSCTTESITLLYIANKKIDNIELAFKDLDENTMIRINTNKWKKHCKSYILNSKPSSITGYCSYDKKVFIFQDIKKDIYYKHEEQYFYENDQFGATPQGKNIEKIKRTLMENNKEVKDMELKLLNGRELKQFLVDENFI